MVLGRLVVDFPTETEHNIGFKVIKHFSGQCQLPFVLQRPQFVLQANDKRKNLFGRQFASVVEQSGKRFLSILWRLDPLDRAHGLLRGVVRLDGQTRDLLGQTLDSERAMALEGESDERNQGNVPQLNSRPRMRTVHHFS
jgi:hypothetical protein